MSDSTNVERPGYASEKIVGKSLEIYHGERPAHHHCNVRVNVSRLRQILDIAAAKAGRKNCICSRSMEKISKVSMELGYLKRFRQGHDRHFQIKRARAAS